MFYQVRQNWRGKAVLLKLIWRMVRARVFGDRMAAIGQSLAARMRLALKQHDVPLWLDAPMTSLISGADGAVLGAVIERDGRAVRIRATGGVILASGGFDHDMAWRKEHLPLLGRIGVSAIRRPPVTVSGPVRRPAARPNCSMRRGGSRPSAGPTDGCSSCSTSG